MSHVSSGAVLTLVVPLSLLVVVFALWALGRRWLRLEDRETGRPESPPEA
jgi:hypothetical protein